MAVRVEGAGPPSADLYNAIRDKLGIGDGDGPDGLVFHSMAQTDDGSLTVADVWESEEQYRSFREDTLIPAVREIAGDEAADQMAAQPVEVHEVVGMIKG